MFEKVREQSDPRAIGRVCVCVFTRALSLSLSLSLYSCSTIDNLYSLISHSLNICAVRLNAHLLNATVALHPWRLIAAGVARIADAQPVRGRVGRAGLLKARS